MKRILFSTIITCFLLIACSDENAVEEVNNLEETNDVETLILTNEKLVEQLEKELNEKNELKEEIESLKDENINLKDDILTYKQQTIELEERHQTELSLRDDLDLLARQFFQSMHELEHEQLEESVSVDISILSEDEILKIMDPDGIERNFHYLQLGSVIYIRQKSFSFDHDEQVFTSRYDFYSESEDKMIPDGGVELVFVDEGDWKVSSIRTIITFESEV